MKSQTFTTTVKAPTRIKNFFDPNVTDDIKLEQIMTEDGWVVSSAQSGYFKKVQVRGSDEEYLYYVAQDQAGDLHLFRNQIWPGGRVGRRGLFQPFGLIESLAVLAVLAVLILTALRANAQVTDPIIFEYAGGEVDQAMDKEVALREYILARVQSDIELFGLTAQELGLDQLDSCETTIKWVTEPESGWRVEWQNVRKFRGQYTTKLVPLTGKTRSNQLREPIIISTQTVLPKGMVMYLGYDRTGKYESTP